ncbi:MAG: hypothetical protein Q9196_007405, partial [Gyalolechia fulgens]
KAERYEIQANRILSEIEIYPRRAVEAFEISLAEVIPKETDLAIYHPIMHQKRATVSLRAFWMLASWAVAAKERENNNYQPRISKSPIDSNYSEPGESECLDDQVSGEEKDDERKDLSYKDPHRKNK